MMIAETAKPNPVIPGFILTRETPLPHLRSIAYEIQHEGTGAKIIHIHNNDSENLFSITFPTPPSDDTGVPHILEHSVLAGSAKYQVKDPFFEMVKSSMATFINAMTGSDYTVYPVASNVRQDFFNLADVYWDAVFHCLLTERTFEREGHHLELARKNDLDSDLIVKGIVFNEMKGARSNPDAKVHDLLEKNLWPDTPYGKDSGGDPEHIPSLTWQGLREFHRRFYHPGNALIFLYGNIPTADQLEFLQLRLAAFNKVPARASIPSQPRWSSPRVFEGQYAVAPTDSTAGKSYVILNWLVGLSTDVPELFAMSALDRILLGNQSARLRKALIDSKLGEDLAHSGYWANGIDTSFHVGLKGTDPEKSDAIQSLVLRTLADIEQSGVTRQEFDSALQQLSYRYLEINPMYPLHLLNSVSGMWLHGADPLDLLHAREHIKRLRDDFDRDPNFFSRLIRAKFLDNAHRLTLIVGPDPQIQSREDAKFSEQMKARKASMSEAELEAVNRRQQELEESLSMPNSPEAIAALPQLKVSDLPTKPRHIATSVEPLPAGGELLINDLLSTGVNYLHVSFDIGALPEELYPYLSVFGDCVQKLGAAGQDYAAVAQRVAACTGGIGLGVAFNTRVDDPEKLVRQVTFTTKFLDENADDALQLLHDIIFAMDPTDVPRLKDVLRQSRAYQRTRPAGDGMALALRHAARGLSPTAYLDDLLGGLPQIWLFEQITEPAPDALIEKVQQIQRYLLKQSRLTASFTGTPAVLDQVRSRVAEWSASIGTPGAPRDIVLPPIENAREGFAGPMNVAYCTAVMPAPHISHPDAARLAVAGRLLGLGYVLEEVRFKGSAYGGGCGYNGNSKLWTFHSYRDPWINRTLDVYAAAPAYVRTAPWTQGDVDRSIIGTAKEGERPIRPPQASGTALTRHLIGDTNDRREARHEALLGVTLQGVKRVLAEQFERGAKQTVVCVVSSREKLEEANRQKPGTPLKIGEILPK
jgi:Zn-dependent M16 (insulinase) family peptidase